MEPIDVIDQIETDVRESNEPFDDIEFPEERLLETVSEDAMFIGSMEGRLSVLVMFAMFDYNRNANQLTDNLIELYKRRPQWYNPTTAPFTETVAEELFEDIGFRYPSRDAHAYVENMARFRDKYHGSIHELLLAASSDAEQLIEQLESDDFLVLKGDKISPMVCRFINEYVCPLSSMEKIHIPVDTHIARLSRKLLEDPDLSKDEIRDTWQSVSNQHDVSLHIIDKALWQIGNNWDDWGSQYWENIVEDSNSN